MNDRSASRQPHQPRPRRAARRLAAALPVLLCLAVCLLAPPPATAQGVPVIDAAHIALNAYWHYVHYLQFAFQIYQHVTEIANQIQQIDNQLRALQKLAHPNWRDIQALLANLDSLVRSGYSIGYSLANPGSQLHFTFPGWTPWLGPGAAASQSQRSLDTMRAGLDAISLQSQTFAPGEQTLAAIHQQMASTDGHQMALEQLTTLAVFAAQEQLLTRQSLAVNANLQAVANAYWIDREAQARAAFNSRRSPGRRPTPHLTEAPAPSPSVASGGGRLAERLPSGSTTGWVCAPAACTAGSTCTLALGPLAATAAAVTATFAVQVVSPLPAGVQQIATPVGTPPPAPVAQPIPTFAAWGLLALVAALATTALRLLRRLRRREESRP
jgi:P-type conjugative transfer protein TrbJ